MAEHPEPIIHFTDFSCGYDPEGPPILRHIDLAIRPGEFVLLVGQSGSGASTLGMCLNGIIPFVQGWTEGALTVGGIDVLGSRVAELATRVGIVFQDVDGQLTNLYVRDEVMFGPENLMLPVEDVVRRAQEALDFVGAAAYQDRFVFELSGGQKQKVVIAAVLAMEPDILFFDEPTANLDPSSSSDVFRFLARLKAAGRTIIIAEYKMDELTSLADRMIVLGDGQVVFDGAPRDLLRRHGSELQDRWGLWIPQAAELELLLRQRKGLYAEPFPIHAEEAIAAYSRYQFATQAQPAVPGTAGAPRHEALIRAEHVTYRYSDGTQALSDVSVEVRAGEILAIVGPNGSGKTTLSKHFVGLLKPAAGSVSVFGKPTATTSTRELTRSIGYVFQYPEHQFVKDRVEDEIAFSLQILGCDPAEIRARVQEVLAIFGLEGMEQRHPYSLSGGEKRRLSVATMVIIRPPILLLDEPTFGQDRRNTEKMMDAVFAATAAGDQNHRSSIVLVTHDMKLVARYATRVIAMHQGRVAFDGPPSALFEDRELLTKVNLEDPALYQIIRSLRERGQPLPQLIESPSQFVDAVVGEGVRV
ncbi:MAG: ABC transporter ATP-binding protein [Roseiflexaceae bacterium]